MHLFSLIIFLSWGTYFLYFSTISQYRTYYSTTKLATIGFNESYLQPGKSLIPFRIIVGVFQGTLNTTYIRFECHFFLFLPLVGVQNFDSWRSDDLADGINLRLARLPKRP